MARVRVGSPLVRPSDWSYPREFGKREPERFAAGSRHNEPRCMRGRIYTPGALYVARAGTATKRDAPLMTKVEPISSLFALSFPSFDPFGNL